MDNALRDLNNSSYLKTAASNNCCIIYSKYFHGSENKKKFLKLVLTSAYICRKTVANSSAVAAFWMLTLCL